MRLDLLRGSFKSRISYEKKGFIMDFDYEMLLKTTSDLVKIESINPPGLEEAVGEYLIDFLREASIETSVYPVENGRFNVVGRIKGTERSPSLVFTGHMDVVPVSGKEKERWDTRPFSGEIKDGFLYGRGSSDMKGGLASAMVAMSEIAKRGIRPARDIYLIATVDEEDGMKGSRGLLKEAFLDTIGLLVVCEPTGLKICTAGKGRTYADIRVTGQTGHGSQGKGGNVIDFARQLMNKMHETSFTEYENTIYGSSFWQPLSISAGREPCIIPDELVLKVDARLVPDHRTEDIWLRMEGIIKALEDENPGCEAAIEIIDRREGWILPAASEAISKLKDIYEDLNIPFETTFFAGTTDGSILRKNNFECLIVGPGDLAGVHRENERVSLQDLVQSCRIYLEMMKRS